MLRRLSKNSERSLILCTSTGNPDDLKYDYFQVRRTHKSAISSCLQLGLGRFLRTRGSQIELGNAAAAACDSRARRPSGALQHWLKRKAISDWRRIPIINHPHPLRKRAPSPSQAIGPGEPPGKEQPSPLDPQGNQRISALPRRRPPRGSLGSDPSLLVATQSCREGVT